jgi:putative Mg2+ transporter-C (MgtC) family protein
MDELLIRLGVSNPALLVLGLERVGRLLVAAVLGGVLGLEREIAGKPAGLRTNLLICVGAALFMEMSISAAALSNPENVISGRYLDADRTRIAAQIVSGIGFLGAGAILQSRGNIIGLTTAATIWVVAAIGMAVGAQAYIEAIGATILVYLALRALSRVEVAVTRRWASHRYIIELDAAPELVEWVQDAVRRGRMRIETSTLEKQDGLYEATFHIVGPLRAHERLVRVLAAHEGVRRVTRAS